MHLPPSNLLLEEQIDRGKQFRFAYKIPRGLFRWEAKCQTSAWRKITAKEFYTIIRCNSNDSKTRLAKAKKKQLVDLIDKETPKEKQKRHEKEIKQWIDNIEEAKLRKRTSNVKRRDTQQTQAVPSITEEDMRELVALFVRIRSSGSMDIEDWLTIKKQVGISEDNVIETMKDDIDYEMI